MVIRQRQDEAGSTGYGRVRIGRLDFSDGGVTWLGRNTKDGSLYDLYWLYPFNRLEPERRYWGRELAWRTAWTPWTVEPPWADPTARVE